MKKADKKSKPISAERIAGMADRGEDSSRFFTNHLRMVRQIQRVNVDFTGPMLLELDQAAEELNISRQAVIKTLVREGWIDGLTAARPVNSQAFGFPLSAAAPPGNAERFTNEI